MTKRTDIDVRMHNRHAWDHQVARGNMWTRPVASEQIDAARRGVWSVVLVGQTPTPRAWLPDPLAGTDVLCLASGGGQQGPVLAAAGADVTVYDNSPAQLAQDRSVADAEGLRMKTVEGDMARLDAFADASFDVVFHPVSNVFVPDVLPVWREAYRVLRPGGRLLAGFMNPAYFLCDWDAFEATGERVVRHALPYSDLDVRSDAELAAMRERGEPVEFGHTLEQQIGGQLAAGFLLVALHEADRGRDGAPDPLSRFSTAYIATHAVKPREGDTT